MSRPLWVGTLSFGLVSVPVRLYSATSSKQVQFHLLHAEDGARIQNKRVCSADGQEVPYEHVVKGYELGGGRYVPVTRGELEAFDPAASRVIELEDFVGLPDIDPIFFDAPYHLVPAEGAERAYTLLVTALRESGRVGVGRFVLYQKGHLCAVRPYGRGLLLCTLRYADEVVPQDSLGELGRVEARPQERELGVALRLIEGRSTDFEPARYHDVYRERLMAFIERRARAQQRTGRPVRLEPVTVEATPPGELLSALEESVAALRAGQPLPPMEGALRVRPRLAARQARQSAPTGDGRDGDAGEEEPTS